MLQSQVKKLETEIRDCEARMKLHEARVSYSAQVLRSDVQRALTGKTVAIGGAVLGSLAAWWFTRRHDDEHELRAMRRRQRRRDKRRRAERDRPSNWEMLQRWTPILLPLLSPLLSRKAASFLATLGLPVAVKPTQPLPTVAHLDLQRYSGRWYEIARLPLREEEKCARDVSAEYLPEDNGLVVINRCVQADGTVKEAQGRARVPDARQPGELEVCFAPGLMRLWPGSWADYWVLFVDEDYRVALVGTPDRDGLWILSRTPQMEPAEFEALSSLALRYGFDTSRLIETPHSPASEGVDKPEDVAAAVQAAVTDGAGSAAAGLH
jgi:apolipoprotein D and lipocalin family protein